VNGPSYRFRLERVRALRERREDQAKVELAGAMIRRQQCEEQLAQAVDRVAMARRAQTQAAASSAADLIARQAYLERVERAHRAALEELHRHEATVAEHRDALSQAAQARQALERLKARGLDAHRREAARVEGLALDEIAITGFRRRAAA
jgi:flagellar export protein FliJ